MKEKEFKSFYQEEMKFSYVKDEEVKVINVICTKLLLRGEGTSADPYRKIEQYWSMSGELLWENDPYKKLKRRKKLPSGILGRK